MKVTSVSSRGRVTIPKELRQKLGIRQGSSVEFVQVGDRVEMRVRSSPTAVPGTGFGMLKTPRKSVPADFDTAMVPK
jgi:AbrB family looped-hinge helix DNA binding protein